jgi:biotin synthase
MVMHPQALEDTLELTEKLAAGLELPVSVLVNPSTTRDGDIAAMREAGADMVSVAVDAATEELFDRHRGRGVGGPHRWQRYWRALEEAAIVFGDGRYGCHLIAGLGESEREMLETVQRVRDMGGRSHLFSFYPERGSRMENEPPCPANRFRRIQLARYLIDYDMVRVGRMSFDERGRVSDFGLEASELDRLVETGKPFMTSGCPGSRHECACNRPFGDGPPGDIRSFPFPLDEGDLQTVKKQLATYRETCDGMGERLFESKG